jgi:ribosomal protein S18 acetylase RimI-like enzyme
MKYYFRTALVGDSKEITNLHYDSGVMGMLRYLHPHILEAYFYKEIITDHQFDNYVAVNEDNQIIAFMSIKNLKSINNIHGIKMQLKLFAYLAARIFQHPDLILLFINYLRSYFFIEFRYMLINRSIKHEIQILIVSQKNQKNGVGKSMLSNYFRLRGASAEMIVQTQNLESIKFYEKLYFRKIKRFRLINKCLWVYELKNQPVQ